MILKVILLFSHLMVAHAYKIIVYTDQPSDKKAQEVIDTFKKTYPFNSLDIELDIKNVSAEQLNCHSLYNIERLIGCDSANIAKDAAKNGADQAFIVKNSPTYGGSGGSIPVITAGSTPKMILHEYLHTLGLCDEYCYAAEEANKYCNNGGANMAIITPNPSGYSNDLDARKQHMGNIPWNEFIASTTFITHDNETKLGTGIVTPSIYSTPNETGKRSTMGAKIGLYAGKTCALATPPKKTWQPGQEATIMEFLDAGLGAGNEEMVLKALLSRGAHLKEGPSLNPSSFINNAKRSFQLLLPAPATSEVGAGVSK